MTGPAPYWSGDGVTLYLGDALEVTAWLDADVLVTDPPYGRGWRQGRFTRHTGGTPRRVPDSHEPIAGDADTAVRDAALMMWDGTRPGIVFADLREPPPGAKLPLVYIKPWGSGARGGIGGFRRDIEGVYLTGRWPSQIGGASALLRSGARAHAGPAGLTGRYAHPHAKPVDVCEQLIAACPPGTVADPFAGSGSVLIAARNLGRPAIGVEIDPGYAETCARRLAQAVIPAAEP